MSTVKTNAIETQAGGTSVLTIGTAAQTIKLLGGSPGADKVLTSDATGGATWEVIAEPKVLQFVSASPDLAMATLSVTSWTEVDSGFRISITPQVASSTLHITCTFMFGGNHNSNICHLKLYDITNTSDISLPTNGGLRTPCHAAIRQYDADSNDCDNVTIEVQVAAATTVARTYGLYMQNEGGAIAKYFFGTATNAVSIGIAKPMFKVMEVAA